MKNKNKQNNVCCCICSILTVTSGERKASQANWIGILHICAAHIQTTLEPSWQWYGNTLIKGMNAYAYVVYHIHISMRYHIIVLFFQQGSFNPDLFAWNSERYKQKQLIQGQIHFFSSIISYPHNAFTLNTNIKKIFERKYLIKSRKITNNLFICNLYCVSFFYPQLINTNKKKCLMKQKKLMENNEEDL